MVFSKQQEIQKKLTALQKENAAYAESLKLQQERILSLSDQLQSMQIAARQSSKTLEDAELKLVHAEQAKTESQRVLKELNEKFVHSQTQLEDAKHSEMVLRATHVKEIPTMADK